MEITYFLRRILLSSVACLDVQYFSKISFKQRGFWARKCIENKTCVVTVPTNFI
jgi:hypothetical protein